jgi:Concanavalin A-like lectin/glucanases superfamily
MYIHIYIKSYKKLYNMNFRKYNFTIIELLVSVTIIAILFSMLMPAFNESREKARFARWLQFNKQCSNDPKCLINLNFQDYSGDALKNSALGYEGENFSAGDYNGIIKGNYELVQGRWKKGKKAILFDGMSTYVEFPRSKYVDFDGTTDFTIIVWVNFDFPSNTAANSIFSQSYKNISTTGYCLYFVQNEPAPATKVRIATAETGTSIVKFNNMDKGKAAYIKLDSESWFQVVMRNKVVNGNQEVHIFVNGIELNVRNTTLNATRIDKSTAKLAIGCKRRRKANGNDVMRNFFKGKMDEFLVYSRALSNREIKGNYEMGNVHAN